MNNFFLIAGPCSIENDEIPYMILENILPLVRKYEIPYIFKASWKKANRTKLDSFSGLSEDKALSILKNIKNTYNIDVITDIHESHDVNMVQECVTHLQIPAFLCRQTELLVSAAKTGMPVNIKKGQFSSPNSMKFAVEKVKTFSSEKVFLTERGTTFGYENLVVDFTSLPIMKSISDGVILDVTHSVQKPNQNSGVTGGDKSSIGNLARSAICWGVDGLFMEVHTFKDKNGNYFRPYSDADCQLEMDNLESILIDCINVQKALK
jgi:2-dehydro-3-deoxyphosphooctonate aldolase (KDO 8-P synthase)